MAQPSLLNTYTPAVILGDGNCLFRAVSLALYRTQEYHSYLRLMTAIEMVEYPNYYDTKANDYHHIITNKIYTSLYKDLINTALRDGCDCELMHVYALSAVIKRPIQSFCPPGAAHCTPLHPHPYTLLVLGRDVDDNDGSQPVPIMWTSTDVPGCIADMWPNHIACLLPSADYSSLLTGSINEQTVKI